MGKRPRSIPGTTKTVEPAAIAEADAADTWLVVVAAFWVAKIPLTKDASVELREVLTACLEVGLVAETSIVGIKNCLRSALEGS